MREDNEADAQKISDDFGSYFEMDARRTTEEGGSYLMVMTD